MLKRQPSPIGKQVQSPALRPKIQKRIVKKIVEDDDDTEDGFTPVGEDPIINLFTMAPTALAKVVFPSEVLDKWLKSGSGIRSDGTKRLLKVRDIWELTSAGSQCTNTVGPLKDQQPCWICGEGIPTKATKKEAGRAGQCEHILPIAQGVMLWRLYCAEDRTLCARDPEYKEYLKMEYDWAHTVCNQVKSRMVLLKPTEDKKQVEVDNDKVAKLLGMIYNSTRKDSAELKSILHKKYKTEETFIKDRSPQMIANKVNPIVKFLNVRFQEFGGRMIALQAAVNLAGRVDPVMEKIWNEYNIQTPEDIAVVLEKNIPISIVELSSAEEEAAPEGELFTYDVTDDDRALVEGLSALKSKEFGGRRRRTRRRIRLYTKDFLPMRRHQSIRISSRRHSVSGRELSF